MHNLVYLIGRVVRINSNIFDDGVIVDIAIQRDEKDGNGLYHTDILKCVMLDELGSRCIEYLQKGDLIGIKGCLRNDEIGNMKVIVNKCTFLTSKKESE